MMEIGPSPNVETRRRSVGRLSARAAAAGVMILLCLLPATSRADAGTGVPGGAAVALPAAAPPTTDDAEADVSFRVVREAEQPLPPRAPHPPVPPMASTGLDLPVYVLLGTAFALIALGALVVARARGSAGRRSRTATTH